MHSKASIAGLGAILCGAILVLASCGQPVPFTGLPIGQAVGLSHVLPAPPAPTSPTARAAGSDLDLHPGSWTNAPQLDLAVMSTAAARDGLALEAEFLPEEQPFAGLPNVTGQPGETTLASPRMEPGEQYHWAMRLRNRLGAAGPWMRFPGMIGYQPTPPPPPVIHALPRDGWVGSRRLDLSWDAKSDPAGIAGFAYALDQSPAGRLPDRVNTSAQQVSLTVPRDGDWYLHVRTHDNAGNASDVATLPIHVDSVPLKVEPPGYKLEGVWNPEVSPLAVQVKASKASQLSLAVLPEADDTPLRVLKADSPAEDASIQWDGKDDKGQLVPPGSYRLQTRAADKTGRTATATAQDPLQVTNKRIVVYLGQQRMVAYEGDKPFVDTLVTTGGPELPTPTGTFHIISKLSPFTFKSPWPKSSPYWYPDSPTTYAMLFESSGYFIHDAPWRSWFGPGSNAIDGRPGQDGTGTHGCVNVPFGTEAKLFRWTDVGTPVIVQE